jgi:hypothetical protein
MKYIFLHISALVLFAGFCTVFGQQAAVSASNSTSSGFLPLSEVREGMKGTAMTVFKAPRPRNLTSRSSALFPAASGRNKISLSAGSVADRGPNGRFCRNVGSPVYIGGKLVGAISYSFPFSKEPICGITPIEQMVAIFEKKTAARTASNEPRKYSFGELVSTSFSPGCPIRSQRIAALYPACRQIRC